jgi:hypothetical protein
MAITSQLRAGRQVADEQRAFAYVERHYGTEASFSGLAALLQLSPKLPVVSRQSSDGS